MTEDLHQARYIDAPRAKTTAEDIVPTAPPSYVCPYCDDFASVHQPPLLHHVQRDHATFLLERGIKATSSLFEKHLYQDAADKAKLLAERNNLPPKSSTFSDGVAAGSTFQFSKLSLLESSSPNHKGSSPHISSPVPSKRRSAAADSHAPRQGFLPHERHARLSSDYGALRSEKLQEHGGHKIGRAPQPQVYDADNDVHYLNEMRGEVPFTSGGHRVPLQQPKKQRKQHKNQRQLSQSSRGPSHEMSEIAPVAKYDILLQPDSRPISQEQLAAEVKSIYAGLTMVENKCIHVDEAEAQAMQECGPGNHYKLPDDHWQALIALHRTLLHEHHDFLLASQHPSASPALQRLAVKYSMPARMWKHGIHSFLELLRRRLPESLDYMLAFIYLAYQMMALLYETVPAFEDTWIECLGDLARYRMAIEDDDVRDRETWAGVARFWYNKAADKSFTIGRLYHHLAILARPNALKQLYYYSRSLTCVQPFMSARESILTLLDPVLTRGPQALYSQVPPIEATFIKAHAILFGKTLLEEFDSVLSAYLNQLDSHIGRVTAKWREQGAYIAVTNIAGFFDYGSPDAPLRQIYDRIGKILMHENKTTGPSIAPHSAPLSSDHPASSEISDEDFWARISNLESHVTFSLVSRLAFSGFSLVLRRLGDKNVLPHVHVLLVFLSSLSSIPQQYVGTSIFRSIPWAELTTFLNTLAKFEPQDSQIGKSTFPRYGQSDIQPLPEDYQIRGQVWSQWYFPEGWFAGVHDEEERSLELASTLNSRTERILWLGVQLACRCPWIEYNRDTRRFSVSSVMEEDEQKPALTADMNLDDSMDVDQPAISLPIRPFGINEQQQQQQQHPFSSAADMPKIKNERFSTDFVDTPECKPPSGSPSPISGESPISDGSAQILLKNFTAVVCEKNMLLRQRETFKMLLQSDEWDVIIPYAVVTDLVEQSRIMDFDGSAAKEAISLIKAAIAERRRIYIVNAEGTNVTEQAFHLEMNRVHDLSGRLSHEELLFNVTRSQSDLNRHAQTTQFTGQSKAEPAVLITDDKAMRYRARAAGIVAIAASKARRMILSSQRRSDSFG